MSSVGDNVEEAELPKISVEKASGVTEEKDLHVDHESKSDTSRTDSHTDISSKEMKTETIEPPNTNDKSEDCAESVIKAADGIPKQQEDLAENNETKVEAPKVTDSVVIDSTDIPSNSMQTHPEASPTSEAVNAVASQNPEKSETYLVNEKTVNPINCQDSETKNVPPVLDEGGNNEEAMETSQEVTAPLRDASGDVKEVIEEDTEANTEVEGNTNVTSEEVTVKLEESVQLHTPLYRKGDDGYDSDSSLSVSSDDSSIHLSSDTDEKKIEVTVAADKTQQHKKKKGKDKDVFEVDMRTKGEITFDELPLLDELKIDVDPKVVLMEVGAVQSILGPIVIVQANKMVPALDEDTILFSEKRIPIGQVFETFGPVPQPLYVIRFNTPEEIESRGVVVGNKVFYAPNMKEYTRFVFVEQLKQIQGSDASWEHNNEPPEKHLDYSDDEEERKARHRNRGHEPAEGEEQGDATNSDKKRRKRKPRPQNNASEGHAQHAQGSWPPPDSGSKWSQPAPPGVPQWPPAPPPAGTGYRQSPAYPPPRGHMMQPRHPVQNQFPAGGPPTRPWRPVSSGNFSGGWNQPNGYDSGRPNSRGFGGGQPNQGVFDGSWSNTGGQRGNGGFGGWPGSGVPPGGPAPPQPGPWGGQDGGPAHRGPMDMRYVQNMDGPPPPDMMGPGPRMAPHPHHWQDPRGPYFRPPPSQFGGAPSFANGPPGWNG